MFIGQSQLFYLDSNIPNVIHKFIVYYEKFIPNE